MIFITITNLCYIFTQHPFIIRYYCFLYCRFHTIFDCSFSFHIVVLNR